MFTFVKFHWKLILKDNELKIVSNISSTAWQFFTKRAGNTKVLCKLCFSPDNASLVKQITDYDKHDEAVIANAVI